MKVLIIYNRLWHYRIPVFEILGNLCDLTVCYSLGDHPNTRFNFNVCKIPIIKIGRFVIHKIRLVELCKPYDVVIGYGDIAWLSIMRLGFIKRKFKLAYWGIGVRASYKNKFNQKSLWNKLRFYLYSKADAVLLYSNKPLMEYVNHGWDAERIFVANNTVAVKKTKELKKEKNTILFVGTLYKQKGLFELLEAYSAVANGIKTIPKLNIIGDGEAFGDVKSFIENNNLSESIKLLGAIYDEEILSEYFLSSIACISPGQAGLSVLKAMGYGCPFITKSDAYTGGELFNISHNMNGVIYSDKRELIEILKDITINKEKYYLMGEEAYQYYYYCRKPNDMAYEILNLINYLAKSND